MEFSWDCLSDDVHISRECFLNSSQAPAAAAAALLGPCLPSCVVLAAYPVLYFWQYLFLVGQNLGHATKDSGQKRLGIDRRDFDTFTTIPIAVFNNYNLGSAKHCVRVVPLLYLFANNGQKATDKQTDRQTGEGGVEM